MAPRCERRGSITPENYLYHSLRPAATRISPQHTPAPYFLCSGWYHQGHGCYYISYDRRRKGHVTSKDGQKFIVPATPYPVCRFTFPSIRPKGRQTSDVMENGNGFSGICSGDPGRPASQEPQQIRSGVYRCHEPAIGGSTEEEHTNAGGYCGPWQTGAIIRKHIMRRTTASLSVFRNTEGWIWNNIRSENVDTARSGIIRSGHRELSSIRFAHQTFF